MTTARICPVNASKSAARPESRTGRADVANAKLGALAATFRSVGPFDETAARLVGRSGIAERELRFLFGYPPSRQVYRPRRWEVRGVLVWRLHGYWVWSKQRGRNAAGWHPLDNHVVRVEELDGEALWVHPAYVDFHLTRVISSSV